MAMNGDDIHRLIEVYEQIYFTFDDPVPFKEHLKIYPVLVKDYYNFYSLIDMFTMEKNEDPTGIGLKMSNLGYLIHQTEPDNPNSETNIRKIINLLAIVFRVKNGIKCECDEDNDTYVSYEDVYKDFQQQEEQLKEQLGRDLQDTELLQLLYGVRVCPKCGKIREDVIRFNTLENGKKNIIVDNVEIKDNDFDLLRKIVCFQNMVDYDDEYIDPELKAELEEAARLENPEGVSPTLEKQITCIIASTNYTYQTIQDVSLRHLTQLLRTVDAKLHYMVYRQAEASGLVTFKNDISHWIYSTDKHSKLDKLKTLDSLKEKLANVAK